MTVGGALTFGQADADVSRVFPGAIGPHTIPKSNKIETHADPGARETILVVEKR